MKNDDKLKLLAIIPTISSLLGAIYLIMMYQDIKGLVKNFDNIHSLLNSINTTKMTTALNGLTSEQVNNVTFSDFNFLATNLTLAKKKGLQAMINHIKRIVNT